MTIAIIHKTHANSYFGDNKKVVSNDKQISLPLSLPGTPEPGINPEQIFACGYSACFGMALKYIAKEQKIELDKYEVAADVELHKDETGFLLQTLLDVNINSMDEPTAKKLITAAHKICPYSRAVKGNLKVITKFNGHEIYTH